MQPIIANDNLEAILKQNLQVWSREMFDYVEKNKDNMTSRNILAQRTIGASAEIDTVVTYDRTGPGAQIIAKGAVPEKNSVKTALSHHVMYQIATGFTINAKDLKLDPKLKNRLVDIGMRDIHRLEDEFAMFGSAKHGVTGIVGAAQKNENGKIVAAGAAGKDVNNNGSWYGEAGTDIYDDLNTAIGMMDGEAKPAYLIGTRTALRTLYKMDSERTPYYKTIAPLFGKKNENDTSWMWETAVKGMTDDKVYLVPKDFMFGEYVVSENPRLVSYALSAGENYPIEIISWSCPEIHNANGFVELAIN